MKITLSGQFYRVLRPLGTRFKIGALVALVLILAEAAGLLVLMTGYSRTKRFIQAKRLELKTIESLKPNPPSEKRLQFVREDAKRLLEFTEKIQTKSLFWPRLDYSDAERLEFKEQIFSLREEISKKAEIKKIIFEKAAELENLDEALPESARLAELFMALTLSRELREQLIGSGIARIEELNFPEAKTESFGGGIERYEYSFALKLNTNWASLSRLLSRFSESRHSWGIEKVVVQNKPILAQGTSEVPDAPLYADLVLKGTFFGRKTSHAAA